MCFLERHYNYIPGTINKGDTFIATVINIMLVQQGYSSLRHHIDEACLLELKLVKLGSLWNFCIFLACTYIHNKNGHTH